MKDARLALVKKKLMEPGWTEDLESELKLLNEKDAIKIVESMTNQEIYSKVNNRRFQSDYISDYLLYLWEISEEAFWHHIKVTFESPEGILRGDEMQYFGIMTQNEVPNDVIFTMIDFISYRSSDEFIDDLDAIGCILKAQVKKYNKMSDINEYVKSLQGSNVDELTKKIQSLIKAKCNYNFEMDDYEL